MVTKILLLLTFLLLSASLAFAADLPDTIPAPVRASVPDAAIVGQGTLTYLVWDVYDATLIAPHGIYQPNEPFALHLVYKRHVDGAQIADTSASEIERQGYHDETRLAQWHQEMLKLFGDVDPDTHLSGVYVPGKPTCFYREAAKTGCIDDPDFGPHFFNIWLAPDTRAPELRKALLGQSE